MVKKLYVCEICGNDCADKKAAINCEAQGEPIKLAPGTVLITEDSRKNVQDINVLTRIYGIVKKSHGVLYYTNKVRVNAGPSFEGGLGGVIETDIKGNVMTSKSTTRASKSEIEKLCNYDLFVKACEQSRIDIKKILANWEY